MGNNKDKKKAWEESLLTSSTNHLKQLCLGGKKRKRWDTGRVSRKEIKEKAEKTEYEPKYQQ